MSDVKTLLIVDDSITSRQILRTRFSRLRKHWQIFDSDNGSDAIDMVSWVRPDYVTMDVNMPNMSGLEAAERIVAAHPGIRVALITANVQEGVKRRATELGFGFIEKPIHDERIVQALEFLEGSSDHV